jgi:hypothetical protein
MWLLCITACSVWITADEHDARLIELGYVDLDGDGRPDVPDDTVPDGPPVDWKDTDLVVMRIKEDITSVGGGRNVAVNRDVDGTRSRMVYCEAPGGEGEVNRIDDPEIPYAYDQTEPYETPVRGGRYPHGVPALLPWAPEWRADSGEVGYNFELVTDEPADCWAIEKYGVDRDTGTLRVRVVLSSRDWSESDLGSHNYDSAMQKVDEAFAAVGITLERTLETASDACTNATLSDYDVAGALAECVVTPGERELTLIVVDTIDDAITEPGEHTTIGLAPGVPFVGQGAMSAAFVSLEPLMNEGDSGFGRDVAHAMGHFLGLWELWEYDANRGDPLTDTEECTASVADDYTACPSITHNNVMFPSPTPTSGFALTPDQGWVMRRAALVR